MNNQHLAPTLMPPGVLSYPIFSWVTHLLMPWFADDDKFCQRAQFRSID